MQQQDANPWKKGPPPVQPEQEQDLASAPAPAPAPAQQRPAAAAAAARVGRVHHNLDPQDAQIHAYQLSVAQQMCLAAMAQGRDLASFQLDVARSSGLDERALMFQLEPFTLHLTGTEPPLGLTLIRDDEAYTHIELLQRYPHLGSVNLLPVDLKLSRGAMHLAIASKEAQVHEALKYGYWMLPNSAAREIGQLNELFAELCGIAPIYLFLACLESCSFSGVAEMVAPATPAEPGPNGKYANMHRIPIRFVMCKNVPFSALPFINLYQQQQAGVLLQPMHGSDASRALSQCARYPLGTSVLMDFKHFDEAEAKGQEGESGEAALRAAQKAKMFHRRQAPTPRSNSFAPSAADGNNHETTTTARRTFSQQHAKSQNRESNARASSAASSSSSSSQQQQPKWLVSANEERVTLPNKIVYEVTAKKSNKERKHEAKLRQEEQRRLDEEEYSEQQQQPVEQ